MGGLRRAEGRDDWNCGQYAAVNRARFKVMDDMDAVFKGAEKHSRRPPPTEVAPLDLKSESN